MKGPFKMKGMTFKEGQSPMRQLTLSGIGKKIASKIEGKVGDVITNIKNIPKNIKEKIEKFGSEEEIENGNGDEVTVTDPDIDTSVSAEGTIVTPDDELIDVTKIIPTSPITKRSPAKIYKKSAKKLQKKY